MEIHISRPVYLIFGVWIKWIKVFTLHNYLEFGFSNPSPLEDFTPLKFSISYSNGTQISVDVFFCSGIRNQNFIQAKQSHYHWHTSLPIYNCTWVVSISRRWKFYIHMSLSYWPNTMAKMRKIFLCRQQNVQNKDNV